MKNIEKVNGLYPDIHSKALIEFFGEDLSKIDDSNGCISEGSSLDTYIVCFTNRCGSNFLCDLIASDGSFLIAGENLNSDVVISKSKEMGFNSFPVYLQWLFGHIRSKNGWSGLKATVSQLIFLYNVGFLAAFRPKIIFVERLDVLSQAISYNIALQTKQWTSFQVPVGNSELVFDAEAILSTVNSINYQNSTFKTLFDLLEVLVLRVNYEGLIDNPIESLEKISKFLGVYPVTYVAGALRHEKQADVRNARFHQRFREAYSL